MRRASSSPQPRVFEPPCRWHNGRQVPDSRTGRSVRAESTNFLHEPRMPWNRDLVLAWVRKMHRTGIAPNPRHDSRTPVMAATRIPDRIRPLPRFDQNAYRNFREILLLRGALAKPFDLEGRFCYRTLNSVADQSRGAHGHEQLGDDYEGAIPSRALPCDQCRRGDGRRKC